MGGTRPAVSGLGGWCARMVLVCGVGAVLCGGCHFSQEWHFSQERYERTEYLEAPLEAQRRFAAETYNGAVRVSDIAGDVRVKTHNGEVRLERVVGRVDLETHNGSITLR